MVRCLRRRQSRRRRRRSRRRRHLSRRRSRRRRRSHRETKSGGVDGVGDDNLFMFVFVVEWNFSSACKTGLLAKSTHSHRLIIAPTSAMARLLIAVLAATTVSAFKTPKSRALKVRGGIDIQKLGTALIGRFDFFSVRCCNFSLRCASRRWWVTVERALRLDRRTSS